MQTTSELSSRCSSPSTTEQPADGLFRWLLQPLKDEPWNSQRWTTDSPWPNTQAEQDVIAALARTPLPGENPPWDVKTGRIRRQPPRRRLIQHITAQYEDLRSHVDQLTGQDRNQGQQENSNSNSGTESADAASGSTCRTGDTSAETSGAQATHHTQTPDISAQASTSVPATEPKTENKVDDDPCRQYFDFERYETS